MIIKNYSKKLKTVSQITAVKIYYKDPFIGLPPKKLLPIKVLTHAGGSCTVQFGDDRKIQTLTAQQTLEYIDTEGGYSDTP